MIQIVIPAAGNGQRFVDAGYKEPKHLIPVLGKPMIERVLNCLTPRQDYSVQIITKDKLQHPSRGAVETILQAEIDPEQPLLVSNCDQLVDFDVDMFVRTPVDGAIVVFNSSLPHHSYVETAPNGVVTHIVEKEVISNQAVTGVYFFKRAGDFLDAAKEVVEHDERVKGEYYVSSALARMIAGGYKLEAVVAPSVMLGTPSELHMFEMAAKLAGRWL